VSDVFADGEPVDPQKLRALQQQVNEIRATAGNAYNLISTTINGSTKNFTFHHRSGFVEFKNLTSGKADGYEISCGFTWDSSKYEDPVTVCTPKLNNPGANDIRVSVQGEFEPKIQVWYKDGNTKAPAPFPLLRVNWISSAKYKVEE
jgi:hypothetical protein